MCFLSGRLLFVNGDRDHHDSDQIWLSVSQHGRLVTYPEGVRVHITFLKVDGGSGEIRIVWLMTCVPHRYHEICDIYIYISSQYVYNGFIC